MTYMFWSYVVFAVLTLAASYAVWKAVDLQYQIRALRQRVDDLERHTGYSEPA